MASSLTKVTCIVCMKGKGIFKCEGCSQIFCSRDSINHRHELSKTLEDVELKRNLIYQIFIQQSNENSLLNKIVQLNQQLAVKVYEIAAEDRNRRINLEQKLKDITSQLREARERDDFVERDLIQWTQTLDQLKNELINPQNSTPVITKIRIEHQNQSDIFQYMCNDADDYLIVNNNCLGFSDLLGKNEYTTGQHIIHFNIGQVFENGWILFGIISKLDLMNNNSYSSASPPDWTKCNQIYIAGQYQKELSNDIITLIINCDQRKIQMNNQRMNHTMELSVDIIKCPFPWKFCFNLLTTSTSISILPASD